MPANDNKAWVGLIRKLERLTDLDAKDIRQIEALPYSLQTVENGDYLVREGQPITQCCLLVDGYACRHKTTEDGRRQIVSFHMRGDILDIQHLLLTTADHNVQAISLAKVAWIPMEELRRLAWERPEIGKALWRDTLIDASIFREWVLNVGRRGAKARIAHMLCEFIARARVVGLVSDDRCALPLTQEEIGDATGLTNVHVNRMLRILRDEDVIAVGKRELQIMNWNRLREIGGFDSNYLHAAA